MANDHEPISLDAARGKSGAGRTRPAVDFEIDMNRVVWDPEYRREVLAELRRRPLVDGAEPDRGDRRPGKEGQRKAS